MKIQPLSEEQIASVAKKAAEAILQGDVVVIPTDTVYGLAADATNPAAVQTVYEIKQRDKAKPLPVFVSDIAMAQEFAVIGSFQEAYLEQVWPGKTTVMLLSKNVLPAALGTAQKIGLRIPNHEFVRALLAECGRPITGTSANISGTDSSGSAQEIISQFEGVPIQPDMTIDAGVLPLSKPSTIIDISEGEERIVRTGAV